MDRSPWFSLPHPPHYLLSSPQSQKSIKLNNLSTKTLQQLRLFVNYRVKLSWCSKQSRNTVRCQRSIADWAGGRTNMPAQDCTHLHTVQMYNCGSCTVPAYYTFIYTLDAIEKDIIDRCHSQIHISTQRFETSHNKIKHETILDNYNLPSTGSKFFVCD